ncbi:MAG TPA: hypothetical protein PK280_03995 [Planctomycetota bacterium]|nr:hypothetical protein [Planctomycetota bacterium]
MAGERRSFSEWLLAIDRRLVYLLVLVALAVPLLAAEFAPYTARKLTLPPAPLRGARQLFDRVERIVNERQEAGAAYDKIVLISADFGPQTRAELYPMLECTVRHLMMRRIKFAIMTNVPDGAGYCKEVPEKLARELGCEYGKDWVNFGYKPGGSFLVRQMAAKLPEAIKTDYKGEKVESLPCMTGIKDAGNVSLLVEITGLVGMFGRWPAFFSTPTSRPDMAHGCTSVSIPDAYSDLESGLICGLFEGIAGAAAYNDFLEGIRDPEKDPPASLAARVHMTGQTVAHVLVIIFVALGNAGVLLSWWASRRRAAGNG